jgi:hypothetical protein
MSFQPEFAQFWEKVKESIENKTYAKLTLAKTIGETELKNIYVRPVLFENDVMKLSIIARYKTEEIEQFHSLEEAFFILAAYMNNPFLTALLFTTSNDITFKLNKKRVGTIQEQAPTFKKASNVILEMKEKGI